MQWLKLKIGDRGFVPRSGIRISKKQNVSSPLQYCEEPRDREVLWSAAACQGSNFESCVWRAVSSYSSHRPQEALLSHVHKGGLKPHSFIVVFTTTALLFYCKLMFVLLALTAKCMSFCSCDRIS